MSREPKGTRVPNVTCATILVLPPHSHRTPPGHRGGLSCSGNVPASQGALDRGRLQSKGIQGSFYSSVFLALEDTTFQENYEISHAEPGSAQMLSN